MDTRTILAKVEPGRLQKAVESLVFGANTITVTEQSETEVRGFVTNGDSKQYGVVLAEEHAFCSCPDAMYRKNVCKHAVALALYVIRMPKGEEKEETAEAKPYDLTLVKARKGFVFPA
jgi:uncharacterized Zn finger protein